jgi:SAM-dependent methyltransferase
MVEWCRQNLEPRAPGFRFVHHDIQQPEFNPRGTSRVLPLPAADSSVSLMVAISVFTHTFEDQAVHYLREAARLLRPDGVLLSTWFVFEKLDFPMMQEEQNTLFINERSPWNAVIFDRSWLTRTLEETGLTITRINPPEVRGFQWHLFIEPSRPGLSPLEFPADEAPQGVMRAPGGPQNPSTVGLDAEP